jgi:endonuclease IV
MFQLGLKLWSTNENYIAQAKQIYKKGICHYIELYAVPGSFDQFIHLWTKLSVPFIIHAPHYTSGMNLADSGKKLENRKMAKEAIQFADALKAVHIIFHPGVNGNLEELIRQIEEIYDERILIENKPYFGAGGQVVCNGSSPEEIRWIIEKTGLGFCLDFGHAVCAANAQKREPLSYIQEFLELSPKMFHFTDGDYKSVTDQHLHFGKGSFPLQEMTVLFAENARITNEAKKDSEENLDDFVRDMEILSKILP